MRIMVDTNVLLSALIFGSAKMMRLIEKVVDKYTMILCSHIIDEFRDVVSRKSPKYNDVVDTLFAKLSYEMVYSPKWQDSMPDIRDKKDRPILAAAILADVDIIVSGDGDFYAVEIERPEILSPAEFFAKY